MNIRTLLASACLTFGVATGYLLGAAPARGPAMGPTRGPANAAGELTGLTAQVVPATQTAKPGDQIKATFRITNGGTATQSFRMMSCSWPTEWKSSSTSVSVPTPGCGRNGQIAKTLAAGEKWEGDSPILIDAKAPAGEVTATFTFTPSQGPGMIKSAPVTLTVLEAK
jgi:hypothetical protein